MIMRRLAVGCALVMSSLAAAAALAQSKTAVRPRLADERVILRTGRGDLVVGLFPDVAPRHVEQILKLVRAGVYDSTWFHRVEPNFVVQLSNAQNRRTPLSARQLAAIHKLPAEFSDLPHVPGVVSMAHEDGDPNSAETSFSFLLARAPHLDGKYTVFGELVWGGDVLAAIAATPRDAKNQPLDEIVVETAMVKSAAEVDRMRAAGQLRAATWSGRAAAGGGAPRPDATAIVLAGIGLMMALSLAGFFLAGRLPPHRVSAFSLLTILVGAFLLLRELVPLARGSALAGTAVLVGLVALFKLMNRFESARPGTPPAARAGSPPERPMASATTKPTVMEGRPIH